MLGQNVGVTWWERRGPGVETEEGGESERDREKAGLCQEAGSVALTCIVTGDQDTWNRERRMEKKSENNRLDNNETLMIPSNHVKRRSHGHDGKAHTRLGSHPQNAESLPTSD